MALDYLLTMRYIHPIDSLSHNKRGSQMSRPYNITVCIGDVTWRGRTLEVEAEGRYTPGRAAPACSNPDSSAFSDSGDPPEFELTYLHWEVEEGQERGEGAPDSPGGADLLAHGTVQRRHSVPPDWTTGWVTAPLSGAIDEAAFEEGGDLAPERE